MENLNTKVITGKVRFSYANVWEPKSINGSNPKYSISLLIPKSDTQTLNNIKQAIENAKKIGLSVFNGKVPANIKTPLRDGDIEKPDDEIYAGCYFVNANSVNNGNKGIACGLNNLMKIEDGEPLGGRVSAEIDFEGIDAATLNAEMDEIFG